jgi:hypothetical protein
MKRVIVALILALATGLLFAAGLPIVLSGGTSVGGDTDIQVGGTDNSGAEVQGGASLWAWAGFFVNPYLALGPIVSLKSSSDSYTASTYASSSSDDSIGVKVLFALGPGWKFRPFLAGTLGISFWSGSSTDASGNVSTYSGQGTYVTLSGGAWWMLADKVALSAEPFVSYFTDTDAGSTWTDVNVGGDIGFLVFL